MLHSRIKWYGMVKKISAAYRHHVVWYSRNDVAGHPHGEGTDETDRRSKPSERSLTPSAYLRMVFKLPC